MVGHIAGLGYSQRMSAEGMPLNGCKLYVYATGTSTPVTTYVDYGLGTAHPHPIVADAAGIIPMFWVDDGTYRVRLTDSAGNEIFDDSGIVALGPSSGAASGSSVDANALFDTGDFLWQPVAGTRTGWVRANARTIGSAASGATERANADTETLFTHLWNNYADSLCPVTGGRGGSAAADWAANKVIATLDMRGRWAMGADDMGSTAAGVTPGFVNEGDTGGASSITIAQANLPNVSFTVSGTAATHTHAISITSGGVSATHTHTFSGTSSSDGAHTHTTGHSDRGGGGNPTLVDTGQGSESTATASNGSHTHTYSGTTSTPSADHTHAVSGTSGASGTLTLTATAASGGSGTAITTVPPCRAGTWYIKL